MKKIMKQMLALMLALVVAFTLAPVNAQAAGKVKFANSGKVKAVMYKGAKAKKASFSLNSVKIKEAVPLEWANGEKGYYDEYEVTLNLKKAKLSKTDIIKTVKESRKKGGKIASDCTFLIDANGNTLKGNSDGVFVQSGGLDYSASSSSKSLKAKEGRTTYYIWSWRKTEVYKYKIYIEHGKTGIYLGVAGLKKGQIKEKNQDKLKDGAITYTKAGFGNKKGFAIAGSIVN